jgi:Dihydroorotate dehydrogenase
MKHILKTNFAGLQLRNPIIIGSSGLTNTAAKNKELEKAGAGAVVLKSLFEEQISNESYEMLKQESHPEAVDYINNYFKNNEVNTYLDLIRETKKRCRIPVIASINCHTADSWTDFARQIAIAGADALELNLFYLDTGLEDNTVSLEEAYVQITRKVVEIVDIPIIVKVSKYCSRLVRLVDDLFKAGAAGVVLFNRFYQPDIDIHKFSISSGHVFSSPNEISDTLRWTGIVTGKLPKASIASSTGIHEWEDIVKCILSGASAVEICSTVYQHGYEIIGQMKRTMTEWMNTMQYDSIEAFRGKLNYDRTEDPTQYERVQFMKYFSNRD